MKRWKRKAISRLLERGAPKPTPDFTLSTAIAVLKHAGANPKLIAEVEKIRVKLSAKAEDSVV